MTYSNLYLIAVTSQSKTVHGLSWTAASNPARAWERFLQQWGKYLNADTRKGQIAEVKRKEGAHLIKIAVPCDGMQ